MWKEGPETVLPGSPTNPQMAFYLWLGCIGCSWTGSSLGLAQLASLPIGTSTSGPVDTGGCGEKEEVTVRKGGQRGGNTQTGLSPPSWAITIVHTRMSTYAQATCTCAHTRSRAHTHILCTQRHMCVGTLGLPARAVRLWELGDLTASLHNWTCNLGTAKSLSLTSIIHEIRGFFFYKGLEDSRYPSIPPASSPATRC